MTTVNARAVDPHEIGALIALVNENRLSEAERKARSLLPAHPDAGMLWKILSVALLRQGKDAIPAMRRTAELMPQDAEAHANLGAALKGGGLLTDALASLHRALTLEPNNVETLVDAADALRELGRSREAAPLYRRAIELEPRTLVAHNNLGNALLETGRHEDAIASYRRALDLKPDDAQVLFNLGNALRQAGLLDEAIAATRRALALEPTLSVAHNNLGLALAATGRREEAVGSYRQALQLKPNYVEALNNLGNALRDLGARREAVSAYLRAIELDPLVAESHWNLGNVLFEIRRIDDAAEEFRRALALQPAYAPAHVGLAAALRIQRRGSDAESSCRAALAIDPNSAEALCLLGELHADRGQFHEAEQLFRRAIEVNPDYPFALISTAMHRKMTRDDAPWLHRANALIAKGLPLGREIGLRYALGKYFDDVGQYEEAFAHYARANELTKRYGAAYDGAKLARRVDDIIRHFDGAFLRRSRPEASRSELPILVIGMPRSGTSLAEQILASHPEVFGAGEVKFWNQAYQAYQGADAAQAPSLLPGMAAEYLARLTAFADGARRVVDKMPANFLYAGLIHAALPNARIIHMRRHPIDTCLSIYFQNFFNMGPHANDLDDLAHYYGQYLRVTDHWRALLPASALLEVPYEALLDDQEGWTRRMLDFAGLPWDPRCLDFHRTDRAVITASKWQVRQRINKTSAGRWRHYEKFAGPLLHLAAAPLADHPPGAR
jgi:tetratricopeptide (TPR) repeat protein